jgi:hypothetical protein
MAHGRVKPSNWAAGERLTDTQINQLDGYVSQSLDKTSAGDTLSGVVELVSGAGFVFDAGSTAHGEVSCAGTLTLDGYVKAGTNTQWGYVSRSITRVSSNPMIEISGGAFPQYTNLTITGSLGAQVSLQSLDVPHGAVLTGLSVYVDPANATPPAATTPTTLKLIQLDMTTGSQTALFTLADPATGGTYGTYHAITKTGLSVSIDRTRYLYLSQVVSEVGDAASTCQVYPSLWTATVTSVDEGAA